MVKSLVLGMPRLPEGTCNGQMQLGKAKNEPQFCHV